MTNEIILIVMNLLGIALLSYSIGGIVHDMKEIEKIEKWFYCLEHGYEKRHPRSARAFWRQKQKEEIARRRKAAAAGKKTKAA